MDVVAYATAACPMLLPVCCVLCNCFWGNCGVFNMPAFIWEFCLLHGPTTVLVASSLTAVHGAGGLTVIEFRVSSLPCLELISTAGGGGVAACMSAFHGFKVTSSVSNGYKFPVRFRVRFQPGTSPLQWVLPHKNTDCSDWAGFTTKNRAFQPDNFRSN